MHYIGTNITINIANTISLKTLNQTYCFSCSISQFGKGTKNGVSEAMSRVDMFQALVARRRCWLGLSTELWKSLGIDHNKSGIYKPVHFNERVILPAHLYHIDRMQQAAFAAGNEIQKGRKEDKVVAGKTRDSAKEDGG